MGSSLAFPRVAGRLLALGILSLATSAQTPVALFTTSPNPAEGGAPLAVQFLDQSSGVITSWSWDLGDGTSSSEQNPAHVYGVVGAFDVSLTVRGPGGANTVTRLHAVDVLETLFGFAGAPRALSTLPVPRPSGLEDFVKDDAAALRLGKALFWDIQLGSDGLTACASCHYHAGADNRALNTLHPGANGSFDLLPSGRQAGPNLALALDDFPFKKFLLPETGEGLLSDSDDRRGTAGVFKQAFSAIDPGSPEDLGVAQADGTFQVGGVNTLQVTGRDAPTTLGAVFFHRLFWDGRANHKFNGVNLWGDSDPSAKVLAQRADGSLAEVSISLEEAAAASQAIGPPLSGVEMSWAGRTWADVGRKLIPRAPLAGQFVAPSDSVLGALAQGSAGLTPGLTYEAMIQDAFHERWWGSHQLSDGFTQMERNFSLFFGLAILMYESTLLPGATRYDAFANGDEFALSDEEKRGLGIFVGKGQCLQCHDTPMFAGAISREILVHSDPNEGEGILERMAMDHALAVGGLTLSTAPVGDELLLDFNPYRRRAALLTNNNRVLASVVLPSGARCLPRGRQVLDLVPSALVKPEQEFRARVVIETDGNCLTRLTFQVEWNGLAPAGAYKVALGARRFPLTMPAANTLAVYDNGFYNIGVRDTREDLGVGADGPFGPLSMTRRKQNGATLGTPEQEGIASVSRFERVAVDGAFKTPTLRNVELTGPYFHNGGQATLEQVVEFYARGSDFGNERERDPDVGGFGLSGTDKADLVAFLKSLTDPRVRHEAAPFDHPELPLKLGHAGDGTAIDDDGQGQGVLDIVILPATGAAGGPAIPTFEERLGGTFAAAFRDTRPDGARLLVALDRRPATAVTIQVELGLPGARVEPATLTFTPDDWRTPRNVQLSWSGGAPASLRSSVRLVPHAGSPNLRTFFVPEVVRTPSNDLELAR